MDILNLSHIRFAWAVNEIDKKMQIRYFTHKNNNKYVYKVYIKIKNPEKLYFNDLLITSATWSTLYSKSYGKNIYDSGFQDVVYKLIEKSIIEIVSCVLKVNINNNGEIYMKIKKQCCDDLINIICRSLKMTNLSLENILYVKILN